ncbi:DUF3152 domain-containing protein [Amycolatopsis suaedae]|uniref:DUF3152 domain-containing protein n=1 Tax=Amycolatopsis suaedae TaxID=2510978 RepID=A0A4Q7J773_9PSEU|nr:DUF3152 domain-containing protein [Amycolatopsis suaedae]RZQ62632.1 DUF3152 domain-containing protein [Amycolatopsis suaedae]
MVDRATYNARSGRDRAAGSSSARRSPHTTQSRASHLQGDRPRRTTARAGDDRYRPGSRRTAAEPLTASWQPTIDDDEDDRPRKRGRLARMAKTYGWRVYALPVLLVITGLVVFDTATKEPETQQIAQEQASGSDGSGGAGDAPIGGEIAAQPVKLDIPTAELPAGGEYPDAGKGTWHVVPVPKDRGKRAGTGGKLFTYSVTVEDGIDPSVYQGDDLYANVVENTLRDPRSWTGSGELSLQRVDNSAPEPDFTVALTSPATTKKICGSSIPYEASCRKGDTKQVVINLARWVRGAKAFNGQIGIYREYAINHEVGHALGHGHVGCETNGALAPVMMQQSFGVANNYVAQLNNVPGGDRNSVPADGKVCTVNGWPNPQGQAG